MSIEQQPATFQVGGPWLFLNRAGVCHQIAASEACFVAGIGFKAIHVDALAGNVMAGARALPLLRRTYDTRLQIKKYTNTVIILNLTCTLVA
jgi:hypothetical protein